MNEGERLIHEFYSAFRERDAERMAACYHSDVRFSDPVFQDLRGTQAGDMWRMLCGRPDSDLTIEYRDVRADDARGTAHWEARYTFSTGRAVHNVIDAEFEFADGRIMRHVDRFDLPAWAAQALGLPGTLLGRTPFMQRKIRDMAMSRLKEHQARTG